MNRLSNIDDLFDLESKENVWKKFLYDAPIDDLMTEDKVFDPEILEKKISLTYDSSLLLSCRSEDTIFDPGISVFSCYSLEPVCSPWNFKEIYLSSFYYCWDKMNAASKVTTLVQRLLKVNAAEELLLLKKIFLIVYTASFPNEHQLKFNSIEDAKKLLEAIEKRFGGNTTTRKTKRNLLKKQYENFTASCSEMLDQTFDRLQKLVSQLELLDEKLSQEDVNPKLIRGLPPEQNIHAILWRNKTNLDTMIMDDHYNNLKVYKPEVKGMSSSSSSTQNIAFVSSLNDNTSNTNEAVNTAYGVSTASTQVNAANIDNLSDVVICTFFASQPNSPQLVNEDMQKFYPDDIEEMDFRWQMAMLTMRARRFLKNTGRKFTVNGNETIGFNKSKV
ncbi:hypothetical protein Tco_0378390 [Tanacetum coccineum]